MTRKIWEGWPLDHPGPKPFGGGDLRAYNRSKIIFNQQIQTLEIVNKHEPLFAAGTAGMTVSKNRIDFILSLIHSSSKGRDLITKHNFFVKGLDNGVRMLDWQLEEVPAPMTIINKEKSPFTSNSIYLLHALEYLIDRHMMYLEKGNEPDINSIRNFNHAISHEEAMNQFDFGQILFSAIVHGGMLNKSWVESIGPSLNTPPIINSQKTSQVMPNPLIWVNLKRSKKRGGATREFNRRWLPDPLTSLLLLRWYKKQNQLLTTPTEISSGKHVQYLLTIFFAGMQMKIVDTPKLKQLLLASRTRCHLSLPPYLVHFASSSNKFQPLPAQAWARIHNNLKIKKYLETDRKKGKKDGTKIISYSKLKKNAIKKLPGYSDQNLELIQLRKCLYHVDQHVQITKKEAIRNIQVFIGSDPARLTGMLHAISLWCIELLTHGGLIKDKIKPSSVRTYLSTIALDLLTYGYDMNMKENKTERWVDLYEQILSKSNNTGRNPTARKAARIRAFHHFLEMTYGVPSVSLSYNNGVDSKVDSNMISEAEYTNTQQIIAQSDFSTELKTIQGLILMLGFKTGLRRNEILKLTLTDIQDGLEVKGNCLPVFDTPELFVRANIYRDLKSKSSLRRLPLHVLFSQEERQSLRNYKKKRVDSYVGIKTNKVRLLFCKEGIDSTPLQDDETFIPICDALRKVTGDPHFRFQHLRHSFANLTLIKLVSEDMFTQTDKTDRDGSSLRNKLHLSKGTKPTSKLLRSLSQLSGHLDPVTTISSYLHLGDYILGISLRNKTMALSFSQQATVLGLSAKALKTYRYRNKLGGNNSALALLKVEAKRLESKLSDPILKTMHSPYKTVKSTKLNKSDPEPPSPFRLYSIFQQYHTRQYSFSRLAKIHDFSSKEIKNWINFAKILAGNTNVHENGDTEVKKRNLVPKLVKIKDPSGQVTKTNRIPYTANSKNPAIPGLCPAPPHAIKNRYESVTLYRNIIAKFEEDKSIIKKGLALYTLNPNRETIRPLLKKKKDLITYINFLISIGIAKSRIKVNLRATLKTPIKIQKKYWREKLSLPKGCFSKITTYQRQPKGYNFGKIEIWVLGLSQKRKSGTPLPEMPTWSAASLHFTFFMSAVYLGSKILFTTNE